MTSLVSISIIASCSVILNIFLLWYVIKVLRKLFVVSANLSDIFLTFRSFEVFVESLYGMEMFYGEPIIQELIQKTKTVCLEVEAFRDVFEYTLDEELEEELNAAAEEAE
jgi:hypothetical protein